MPPALPRPSNGPAPDAQDFAAWCEHPVTQWVAACWQTAANRQREAWVQVSWDQGSNDPLTLMELRTRADAYMAFLETGLDDYAKNSEG